MSDTPAMTAAVSIPAVEDIGTEASSIPVELSTRFLEHFSEQLYSSPQKAFEELISNGWDAGADCVDVRISPDLSDLNATMCVLDNGASMDVEGLKGLWRIAFSPKKDNPNQYGRKVIGKFGIGKLATYVLANKLTYICKATDGVVRRVTMNYESLDDQKEATREGKAPEDRLISQLNLPLYVVDQFEVENALKNVWGGSEILELISNGVRRPSGNLSEDEYGAPESKLERPPAGTWTLVVLSGLKPTGRTLKMGILRRMLEAALPFGSEMAINLNGSLLASSKLHAPTMKEWAIGPELGISEIEIFETATSEDADPEALPSAVDEASQTGSSTPKLTKIPITSGASPKPYVNIPGIGEVTGLVRLFEDRISGGKSDERGASNGFHVNVLGRVINQGNPSFGEKDLSHGAWACFRMTVRADGLNPFLVINREQLKEHKELTIFRAFLRKVFNNARKVFTSDEETSLPHGGDVLVKSLGVLSLSPLRNVVSETLRTQAPLPGLFDESGIEDREEMRQSWRENTADNIRNALAEVKYERLEDDSFVKFRINDSTIVVNSEHPFAAEHSQSRAEKELVRTVAMVNLLADFYALDIGVHPSTLADIRDYRDKLLRYRALQRRQSGTYIARLLLDTQHESSKSKQLETVLSDALRYLGFDVQDLARPGEPEGIARAYAIPTLNEPTRDDRRPPLYSFTFDAKTSKHDSSKTGNIDLAAMVDHRTQYNADHALVVAPGFTGEAIDNRCTQQEVTPMRAQDLGKLLEYTVEYGAIPLNKLRDVFFLYEPDAVTTWVENLAGWLKAQRPFTIDIFIRVLEHLKGKVPDALSASTIAYECREKLDAFSVKDDHVIALARGLSILVPDLVGVVDDKVVVNASATRVAEAIKAQLEKLHDATPAPNSE